MLKTTKSINNKNLKHFFKNGYTLIRFSLFTIIYFTIRSDPIRFFHKTSLTARADNMSVSLYSLRTELKKSK